MRVVAKAIALFFDTNTSSFARKNDEFNKKFIKSLCMWIFFCIFAAIKHETNYERAKVK